jgi:protein arginine kinase
MDENLQSIVVSTRIRFARNLAGYPFPHKLDQRQAKEIAELLKIPLEQADDFQFSYTDEMPLPELELLKENYLISQKLIDNRDISALFINPDETMCVMVNEEDHIREQYCATGFCLWKAYEYVGGIDDLIGDCLRFAYDEKLGYLTACPTNLGTGMRASVMLFLPGITKCGMLAELSARIKAMGLTIRGVYGEGSQAEGYMYQVSNEVTLGFDEKRILKEVQDAVVKIAEVEVRARKELYTTDPVGVSDGCGRAYGILTNCRKISYGEFLQLMATLKTGVFMGLYKMTNISDLDELIISMRESNIRRYFAGELTAETVDEQRAQKVRQKIKELVFDRNEE